MDWPTQGSGGGFGGLETPPVRETATFAVLPIPYDGTSTWQKGADAGPAAILAASEHMELYDIETASEPWLSGIVTMAAVREDASPEAMVAAVSAAADALMSEGLVVAGLGGEHSVSIGLIQACARRHPGLTVLQLDAHADTREEYEGSACNHACVMARAREVADIVQVGIRSMDAAEAPLIDPQRTIYAHEFKVAEAVAKVRALIKGPLYITVDLDCLDPSEMPSTGTPEPGGLSYRDMTAFLRGVCADQDIVGFDVVELMPQAANRAPDFLAARLVYQIMAYTTPTARGKTSESSRPVEG